MNEVTTSIDLPTATMRYREEKNWREKCKIAKSFAASRTHLWEECGRRRAEQKEDENEALVHFVSAYFQRGLQQKEELISLLHSQDKDIVWGLLHLLGDAFESGSNEEWQPKRLGGAEIAHHIADVYKTHPSLAWPVTSALGRYGPEAKGEIQTLLRIMLSEDEGVVFGAILALGQIDPDGVYSQQFGLDAIEPLTAEQRAAIKEYLTLQEK